MVTLSLFDTMLSLHCEDIMLELVLKFLQPCKHIPISHYNKINRSDCYTHAVNYFLELSPDVMKENSDTLSKREPVVSKTIGANWNHYGLHSGESLYSNYQAYLFDARHRISQCSSACSRWTSQYKFQNTGPSKRNEKTLELIRNYYSEFDAEKGSKQFDSIPSIGESSGYESFKYRNEEELSTVDATVLETDHHSGEFKQRKFNEIWRISSRKPDAEIELDYSEDFFTQGTVSLGRGNFSFNYS